MKKLARPSQLGDLPPLVARWFLAPGKAVRGGADDVVSVQGYCHTIINLLRIKYPPNTNNGDPADTKSNILHKFRGGINLTERSKCDNYRLPVRCVF